MGMFDTVFFDCPNCGQQHEVQSKSGECVLLEVELENCPIDTLIDVIKSSPYKCECGTVFDIEAEVIPVKMIKHTS